MSDDTHTLAVTVSGPATRVEQFENDGETFERRSSVTITATFEFDSDSFNGDSGIHLNGSGMTVQTSVLRDRAIDRWDGRYEIPDYSAWEVTIGSSLDDWQKTILKAEDGLTDFDTAKQAVNTLLRAAEFAETDRPLLAALNIDETYEVGRRGEILSEFSFEEEAPVDGGEVAEA
jgi:hypothetical protein